MTSSIDKEIRSAALEYHSAYPAGKLAILPTKRLESQRDLALAYSPGVAAACEAIKSNPSDADKYTSRANLVGVVSNGTAVLGLGNIGPLAAKPVMEGKAVLFKKFAGIDVFDIEINEKDPERLIEIIAALEPTFGGINLEDIKAPDCFLVEKECQKRMKIPVFHDDQHGTAIVVSAAIQNALYILGKSLDKVKLVTSGAGAAALACLDLLMHLGLSRDNIFVTDQKGLIYEGREPNMDSNKARFAQRTDKKTLADAMIGADIFLGLSAGGILTQDMVKSMADKPVIMALANPVPEILPELVLEVRPDAICGTGRTDYPNQVNNVLCFPFIFRGALDVGATKINKAMEIAAVNAIANLAREEISDVVATAYGITDVLFGSDYLIPKPFDPRLITWIAPAVAQAAMDSGVATRPIKNMDDYRAQLQQFVCESSALMRPIVKQARSVSTRKKRLMFAEGEDERVLRAAQNIVNEKIAFPVLVGSPVVIQEQIKRYGLRLEFERDYEIVDPDNKGIHQELSQKYYHLMSREGITEHMAKIEMRSNRTLFASMLVKKGVAEGLICGSVGTICRHLSFIDQVIGLKSGKTVYAAMNAIILPGGRPLFLVDTHVNIDPSAEQLAEITIMAAETVKHFRIEPVVAFVSHSNFGSSTAVSAEKMRIGLNTLKGKLKEKGINLCMDGEMQADCALDVVLRKMFLPASVLDRPANILVLPNIDAANITFSVLKGIFGNNVVVGPIILGAKKPVYVADVSVTTRRLIDMAALLVADINHIDSASRR